MPLIPVSVQKFAGLNLRDDPAEVGLGAAVDLLNVDLDEPGIVRTRDGFSAWATTTNVVKYIDALPYGGSGDYVFISDGLFKSGVYKSGALQGSLSTAQSTAVKSFVHVGTPTTEVVYGFNGVAAETLKWDGSSWTVVTITNGGMGCLMPTDNRLVVNDAVASHPSRVLCSDAGAPATFGANNYVDLEPGTSGGLTGLVTWRNYVFAFKTDRFYVFYGNSVDGTGNPVFNYRTVACGVGPASAEKVVVGRDGVYFVDAINGGIFVTTGGDPVRLPGLDMLFDGRLSSTLLSNVSYVRDPSLSYAGDSLFMTAAISLQAPSTSIYGTFVWSARTQQWTLWQITSSAGAGFYKVVPISPLLKSVGSAGGVFMMPPGSSRTLGLFGGTDDNGSAFTSLYRSGFDDLGYSGQEKTVRETELVGQGTPTFAWSRDFGSVTTTSSQAITLGTSPAVVRKLHRKSQDGELLSWQASATSGAWQLNRVTPFLRDVRSPAELTT